jgi:heptaprenyl diphosphate synthase
MVDSTLSFADRAAAPVLIGQRVQRLAQASVLLGAACLLSFVESLLPPMALVPWLRLGLANIAVVVALAIAGPLVALLVSAGRLLIVGLATGTLAGPSFAMAVAGAAASLMVMWLLSRHRRAFSPVGWSAGGAVAHVLGQFAAASFLLASPAIWRLAPASALVALLLGAVVGYLAHVVSSRLPGGLSARG